MEGNVALSLTLFLFLGSDKNFRFGERIKSSVNVLNSTLQIFRFLVFAVRSSSLCSCGTPHQKLRRAVRVLWSGFYCP